MRDLTEHEQKMRDEVFLALEYQLDYFGRDWTDYAAGYMVVQDLIEKAFQSRSKGVMHQLNEIVYQQQLANDKLGKILARISV